MKYILGKKEEMTQYFDENGKVQPATIITADPIVVTQIKNLTTDGYNAIQVGVGTTKESRVSKPSRMHAKHAEEGKAYVHFRELRLKSEETPSLSVGDTLSVSSFEKGDVVSVSGTSKGKGFQGVVKRHGFAGGPRTHGQKHSEREPGSIGGGLRVRVPKGMRMAGRMGGDTITIKHLRILDVIPETNTIIVKGAVPGRRGTLVTIRG